MKSDLYDIFIFILGSVYKIGIINYKHGYEKKEDQHTQKGN